jgi:hypothetical protein
MARVNELNAFTVRLERPVLLRVRLVPACACG